MDFKREIGGSIVPSVQDCERRAAAQMYKLDLLALGFDDLGVGRSSPALRVGKAVHAAVEIGLHEKLGSTSVAIGREQYGDTLRTVPLNDGVPIDIKMTDLAGDILEENFDEDVDVDEEERPSAKCRCGCNGEPVWHFGNLVEKMIPPAVQLVNSIEPAQVEPEIIVEPEWIPGWQIKAHPDVIDTSNVIHDVKTGKNYEVPDTYQAQLGTYVIAFPEAEGIQIDYMKKPGTTQEAPPPISKRYPMQAAAAQAEDQITRFVTATEEFMDPTSAWHLDPRVFRANPSSMMCSKKFCPAFGTSFCELTKGEK